MERLLHYVWKYRLYPAKPLFTTDGRPVYVIDPGISNTNAGPDFFNAKIKIADTLWAGSVEIHTKASDWLLHRHDKNKSYDAVILHVVGCADCEVRRTGGTMIPQLELAVPDSVVKNIEWLLYRDISLPCLGYISEIEPLHLSSWLDALLGERLERKTADIYRLLEQYENDWNEVFYITLTRNFGFGVNNDIFERLAKSLPLRVIRKQRGSESQIEALLFGQAGLLDEEIDCHYYRLLQREYRFLRHKFELVPLDCSQLKSLRTRPINFPCIKLAQLAALWTRYDTLFSVILEAGSIGQIKQCFRISPSSYWETHYHFRTVSAKKEKPIGENSLCILLINTVVPILFAYGVRNKQPEYCDRAIRILESLPPERNSIVSCFCRAGIKASHAGDSQALIQLKRAYCEQKKCLYCRIGFRYLKRGVL